MTETLLLLPSPSPEGRGLAGREEARRGLPPAHLTLHTLATAHRPGHPEALFRPGQEDCVPRLCSSAPSASRGSARKGPRSCAFGSHWINATAVLEGSPGRAGESPGPGLDPRAPAWASLRLPAPRMPQGPPGVPGAQAPRQVLSRPAFLGRGPTRPRRTLEKGRRSIPSSSTERGDLEGGPVPHTTPTTPGGLWPAPPKPAGEDDRLTEWWQLRF